MKCINCGIATQRLRRHITSSLPRLFLDNLAQWLTIEVPMDENICHPCFELLSSATVHDSRLLGYTMICITCGRSVRSLQRHTVEIEDHSLMFKTLPRSHPAFHQNVNYACHPCWMKHQRQMNNYSNRVNVPGPESISGTKQESQTLLEQETIVPNYKRTANTSTYCVFNGYVGKKKESFYKSRAKKGRFESENIRNNKEVGENRAPEKTEHPNEVSIQVKEECNDVPDALALEPNVKIEPVDIKQDYGLGTVPGPIINLCCRNNKEVCENRAPEKTEHQNEVSIGKEECNDVPVALALEPKVKIEPVDIKQEINEDTDDGPSGKSIEVTLKNEYDDYIEINENELIPNVKLKEEDD